MTGTLKDLMTERADEASPPHVDLDAIIRAGDSRVRRRRVAVGAGATAVAASVALGLPAVLNSPSPDQSRSVQPAAAEFAERQVTYALGSTIHYGDQQIDVSPAQKITTFVQTDDGFVFTDASGAIFFTSGAEVEKIGFSGQPYGRQLAADDSGSYVAWVDTSARPAAEFVVYDTTSRSEVVRTSEGNTPTTEQTGEFELPMVRAVDGSYAYWHSSEGITAWDLSTDTASVIAPQANYHWLHDVAAGQLARMTADTQRTVVSDDPAATEPVFDGAFANLSPSATYVYTDVDDELKVFDVQTGQERTPEHPGYPFVGLTEWLDDDTFVAVGIKAGNQESDPLDLLTCSISSEECTVTVPEVGRVNDLTLPIGETLGD